MRRRSVPWWAGRRWRCAPGAGCGGVWRVARGAWRVARGAWRVARGAWRVAREVARFAVPRRTLPCTPPRQSAHRHGKPQIAGRRQDTGAQGARRRDPHLPARRAPSPSNTDRDLQSSKRVLQSTKRRPDHIPASHQTRSAVPRRTLPCTPPRQSAHRHGKPQRGPVPHNRPIRRSHPQSVRLAPTTSDRRVN
ncbi:hypothetical protein DWQ67_08775 [Galactobacter caseinivorans]|uniref:Uncharacterized protein n=1 Tax=Galactobacter caseinivorans TaxID=2676123 RepID=A0A496PHU9_9MICC|nr:hypothetical protein DWQ67_08775 [Galactobacter caseinivorans]